MQRPERINTVVVGQFESYATYPDNNLRRIEKVGFDNADFQLIDAVVGRSNSAPGSN